MTRRWVLPILIFLFSFLSLLTLRSVAPALLTRQLLFFLVGGGIFLVTSRINFSIWLRMSPFLYAALISLLLLTQVLGKVTRGTTSWIPIGSFHIQPSQVAIAIVGLLTARLLARNPLRDVSSLIRFLLITGLPVTLIFLEPDLGTAMVYLVSMASLFFFAKTRWAYIGGSIAVIFLIAVISWTWLLRPYQKERITSFLRPTGTEVDAQYNAIQSVIAVGSGQLLGKGLGQGIQSHLRFLPERQTDFVFASFAEETGFLGSTLLLTMYFALIGFLFYLSSVAATSAERYFCLVTAVMILFQSAVNIGMNMRLVPITGITLPLVSYGGSSILGICFQYGCVQAIVNSMRRRAALHIH